MNPLIILAGPTASGKSETALALAEHFDSEIISADSMQIYKYFDIGTAKPSAEFRQRVPHHLIDILEPDESFTAFDFKTRSMDLIRDMDSRGKSAIMVGGTGLYLKTLLEDQDCAVSVTPETRDRVRAEIREHGLEALYQELKRVDPDYAEIISSNDPARIERAISVYRESGQPLSSYHKKDKTAELPFDTHLFILERERPKLYERINLRVEEMIKNGLEDEVQSLLNKGYESTLKPFQAIGYSQMVAHLEGKIDKDQTIHEIQRETRHYAKRQLTWFKKMKDAQAVPVRDEDTDQSLKEKILTLLSRGVALFLFLFWGWLAPGPATAADTDPFPAAIRLLQKGEWEAARSALEGMQRSKLDTKLRHRVEFLLARVLIQGKHNKEAAQLLKKQLKPYKILEDYVLLELSRAETGLGHYEQAMTYLQRLNKLDPPSLLQPEAGLMMADVYSLMNKPKQALNALQTTHRIILKRFNQPDYLEQIPDILSRQIKIQIKLRDYDGLYTSYRELYTLYPEHEHALEAQQRMLHLTQEQGIPERPLTDKEKKRRLRRLLTKTRFQRLIDEIETLRDQKQNLPPQYYFMLADAHKGLRKRPAANRVLTEYLNKFPGHSRAAKARFLIARNLWNLGNPHGAAEGFQKAIRSSRKPKLAAEARYLLGAVYEDLKKEKKALQEYNALIQKYPKSEFAEKSAWRIGWAHYRAHRWQQAHDRFRKSLDSFPKGNIIEKNTFWLAKTLEKLNKLEDAQNTFKNLALQFPFTYYGLQAANRLDKDSHNKLDPKAGSAGILKTQPNSKDIEPKTPGRPLNSTEKYHFQRGIELMKMGLYSGAQLELLQLNGSIRKTYTGVLWLSTWYNRAHAYEDSLQLLHLFRRYKTKHREKELPSAFWKNFYPPAYLTYVRSWSNRHKVDPWLVTSLMRQESMYDAWALSPAGARGLMQLMPKTARRMARKNGDQGKFTPQILFDPETNIQLGIQYLSGLIQKHKGNRTHVLIAYNAGPKVLKAWKRRFHAIEDPDVFIESIPYSETRNYVKRVSRNHEIYKRLYAHEEVSKEENKRF